MTMTTYTMATLKDTALWTLDNKRCSEGNHKVKLMTYELRVHTDAGTGASLHIIDECKRHKYQVHTYCAI